MLVIFIMILCGAVLLRRGILSSASAKAMSYLVAHVCNPALLLSSAFAYEGKLPLTVFFRGLLVAIGFHAILIAGGFLINTVLRVKREERYSYQLLTAFGNIGFIGIPVCRAVLGPESLVYVSVSCLVFGILFYTYGTATIQNAAQLQHAAQRTGSAGTASGSNSGANEKSAASRILGKLRSIFNIGTIAAALSVVIYLTDPKVPQLVTETASYVGNATVFLSMLVIGMILSDINPKELVDKIVVRYTVERLILIPLLVWIVLLPLVNARILSRFSVNLSVLLAAMPAGATTSMLAAKYECAPGFATRMVILSTLCSIPTIFLWSMVLA